MSNHGHAINRPLLVFSGRVVQFKAVVGWGDHRPPTEDHRAAAAARAAPPAHDGPEPGETSSGTLPFPISGLGATFKRAVGKDPSRICCAEATAKSQELRDRINAADAANMGKPTIKQSVPAVHYSHQVRLPNGEAVSVRHATAQMAIVSYMKHIGKTAGITLHDVSVTGDDAFTIEVKPRRPDRCDTSKPHYFYEDNTILVSPVGAAHAAHCLMGFRDNVTHVMGQLKCSVSLAIASLCTRDVVVPATVSTSRLATVTGKPATISSAEAEAVQAVPGLGPKHQSDADRFQAAVRDEIANSRDPEDVQRIERVRKMHARDPTLRQARVRIQTQGGLPRGPVMKSLYEYNHCATGCLITEVSGVLRRLGADPKLRPELRRRLASVLVPILLIWELSTAVYDSCPAFARMPNVTQLMRTLEASGRAKAAEIAAERNSLKAGTLLDGDETERWPSRLSVCDGVEGPAANRHVRCNDSLTAGVSGPAWIQASDLYGMSTSALAFESTGCAVPTIKEMRSNGSDPKVVLPEVGSKRMSCIPVTHAAARLLCPLIEEPRGLSAADGAGAQSLVASLAAIKVDGLDALAISAASTGALCASHRTHERVTLEVRKVVAQAARPADGKEEELSGGDLGLADEPVARDAIERCAVDRSPSPNRDPAAASKMPMGFCMQRTAQELAAKAIASGEPERRPPYKSPFSPQGTAFSKAELTLVGLGCLPPHATLHVGSILAEMKKRMVADRPSAKPQHMWPVWDETDFVDFHSLCSSAGDPYGGDLLRRKLEFNQWIAAVHLRMAIGTTSGGHRNGGTDNLGRYVCGSNWSAVSVPTYNIKIDEFTSHRPRQLILMTVITGPVDPLDPHKAKRPWAGWTPQPSGWMRAQSGRDMLLWRLFEGAPYEMASWVARPLRDIALEEFAAQAFSGKSLGASLCSLVMSTESRSLQYASAAVGFAARAASGISQQADVISKVTMKYNSLHTAISMGLAILIWGSKTGDLATTMSLMSAQKVAGTTKMSNPILNDIGTFTEFTTHMGLNLSSLGTTTS